MKKTFLSLALAVSFAVPSSAFAQTATKVGSPAMKAVENITAAQLKDYLYFVASDEMEGRNTPSRGLDLTAKFIAMNLSRWGIKPAGDNGTYFQKMSLQRESIDRAGAGMEINGQKFAYGEEFFRMAGTTNGVLNAPLVFVGNGWLVKSKNIDSYQGTDVRGKIAVVQLDGAPTDASLTVFPKGVTRADLKPEAKGTDWADPVTNARQRGAAGVVIVASSELQGFWGQVRQFLSSGGSMKVEGLHVEKGAATKQETLPVLLVSQTIGNVLFEGETANPIKTPGNMTAFAFSPSKKFGATVNGKNEILSTQNVVGMIEGSDPALKAEIVAVGAHYDHVGMNPNIPGEDKIFNGADDDGSGTVAVLAIAEALAKSPRKPKRSILFVWHAGEEKGLWGSEYFVKYPTVDLSKVVTQFNIDMIGRSKKPDDSNPKNVELSGENEIYVIGSKMMSTELGNTSEAINNSYLKMAFNYRYDDPKDPNRFFFRSDHFNYAVKGIPIIFYFDGVHEDYHGVGDHADKIDYAKMEKVTRTILATMWEVADARARPVVDKKLPAELTAR
ncbi:MAG TPA: M20/M25/M40 family metallo-hydrolase [Pyrinomonadaceae bacterium]|nr:M20/M25/M40 family metallo-hydrolase [Pyrinomonadaceae bacterium]